MIEDPISDEEYAARIDAVRRAMAEAGLDAVLAYGAHRDYQPADLRYLARWFCIEEETACLAIPRDGLTTLVTDASWDVQRAQDEAYAQRVMSASDLGATLADILREECGPAARVGIAGYHVFPAPVYLALKSALPDASFGDSSRLTTDLRMIKSPAEIGLMRTAAELSDEAMRAGLSEVRVGRTELDAAVAAEAVIRGAGAEPSFATEMGVGPRTAGGTFLPGHHRFEDGDLAVLDCGARLHGYHGDMCRTVVVGGPTSDQELLLEAVEQSLTDAIAVARPGATVGEVRDAAADSIRTAGLEEHWWDAFMPHGNGTGQHEPPNAKEHPDLKLREGMVLCIEPGLTIPGVGAVIIEQMITVSGDGAEVLNNLPTDTWQSYQ